MSVRIADAVVEQINDATTLPEVVSAERSFYGKWDTTNTGIGAIVLPGDSSFDLAGAFATRDTTDDRHTIAINFYTQIPVATEAQRVEQMVYCVEQVKDLLVQNYQLTALPDTNLVSVRISPAFDLDRLKAHQTFYSVIYAEYQVL